MLVEALWFKGMFFNHFLFSYSPSTKRKIKFSLTRETEYQEIRFCPMGLYWRATNHFDILDFFCPLAGNILIERFKLWFKTMLWEWKIDR